VVVRLRAGRLAPGGPVDVVAIDPATFERGAEWDRAFSPSPPVALLHDLDAPAGRRTPVIVAGQAGGPATAGLVVQGHPVAVRIVDRVRAWPGMVVPGRPLVVVARDAIFRAAPPLPRLRSTASELWERGNPAVLRSRLERAGTATDGAVTLEDVGRRPDLLALTWSIQLLMALGLTAAVVAVAAIVLYLQARQESRALAFALGGRMGLSDRAHRRALTLELGFMLGIAAIAGSGPAIVAALLVRSRLRVVPSLPGPTVFSLPWLLLAVVGVGAVVVASAGGRLAQRRARRTKVAEVLRIAG
jgi:hypothetical protein